MIHCNTVYLDAVNLSDPVIVDNTIACATHCSEDTECYVAEFDDATSLCTSKKYPINPEARIGIHSVARINSDKRDEDTTCTLATTNDTHATNMTIDDNKYDISCDFDMPGGDLYEIEYYLLKDCLDECKSNSSCVAVAWDSRRCYLKSSLSNAVPKVGTVVITPHYMPGTLHHPSVERTAVSEVFSIRIRAKSSNLEVRVHTRRGDGIGMLISSDLT
jgi:hypothetical protein